MKQLEPLKGWKIYIWSFLAGMALGGLSFAFRPDFFIKFFSQWH